MFRGTSERALRFIWVLATLFAAPACRFSQPVRAQDESQERAAPNSERHVLSTPPNETLDPGGMMPLHQAAEAGDIEGVRQLLDAGADVNACNETGQTPLHLAAQKGHHLVVKLLLDRGADPTFEDQAGLTPYHAASMAANRLWKSGGGPGLQNLVLTVRLLYSNPAFRAKYVSSGEDDATPETHHHWLNSDWAAAEGRVPNVLGLGLDSKLREASRKGDIEGLRTMVALGADVNAQDRLGRTALHIAAASGGAEGVRYLLEAGADITVVDGAEQTALHAVAVQSREDSFPSSLERAAHPSGQDTVNRDYSAAARILLAAGIPAGCTDVHGDTPLHLAALGGHRDLAEVLVAHGADLNARNHAGETPLRCAARVAAYLRRDLARRPSGLVLPSEITWQARQEKLVEWLRQQGADDAPADEAIGPSTTRGFPREPYGLECEQAEAPYATALHAAAAEGRTELIELHLNRVGNVNARDIRARTPLHEAAFNGRTETARLLLDRGAKVDARTTSNYTPLHELISKRTISALPGDDPSRDHVATAKLLLERGADPNAKAEAGKTPLHYAARTGDAEMVKMLLGHGADPNVQDESGHTPLHAVAARTGIWLVGQYSNKPAFCDLGRTAELLLSKGARVDARDSDGSTPLHVAAVFCNREVGDVSVKHGAAIKAKNRRGETPLDAAQRSLKTIKEGLPQGTRRPASWPGPAALPDRTADIECLEKMISRLREQGADED